MKNHNNGDYYYQESTKQKTASPNRSFKYMVIIICLVVFMLVIVLLHINQYVQLSRKNLQIEKLKEERNRLKTEAAHLRLKVSKLMSLDRIERVATQKLDMKHPEGINYVVLKQNGAEKESKSEQQKKEATTRMADKTWSSRLLGWFNSFTNAQADTLDD